jgi:hypothetical protein
MIQAGLLTHAAAADCFDSQPHTAAKCGIFAAWWDGVQTETGVQADKGIVMELPLESQP